MDYGLEDAHEAAGCKPSFIGSHTVDGAANAQKFVEVLKWVTKDERQLQITTSECDAHSINTSGKRASGPVAHKVNHNPGLRRSPTLLHTTLTRVSIW